MQVFVDEILAAADATPGIVIATDEPFDKDKYPAIVVGSRKAPARQISEGAKIYQRDWRYEVFVILAKGKGANKKTFADVEATSKAFLDVLLANRRYNLVEETMYESSIAGRETLVNAMLIGARARNTYAEG